MKTCLTILHVMVEQVGGLTIQQRPIKIHYDQHDISNW